MNTYKTITAALLGAVLCMGSGALRMPAAAAESRSLGDVNADGSFSVSDIVLLQKWLLAVPDTYLADAQAGDLDADGSLDVYDLGLMKQLLLNPPAEPEPPADNGTLIPSTVKPFETSTPSTGNVRMLSVYVDFADTKYRSDIYSPEQIREELYGSGTAAYPYESVTAWYERASYGNLHIDGDVYTFTCSGNLSDYMSDGYEKMVMEVLSGLDSQINYADYDSDGDGVIDCMAFTVPLDDADDATKDYWYGNTSTWYNNPGFTVDGMSVLSYIIMDVMPNAEEMVYLKQTLIHEMGHSIGLPDYYKYNSSDWEGLHGAAGYERMDDSIADFCSFSKLMYGWLKDTEVQSFQGSGTQSFILADASQTGSCLILPISSDAADYTSEYFLIEYITRTGNNSDMYEDASGIRIFHIQAETQTDYWGRTDFKYENFAETYRGNDKLRVIRLVNDGGGFFGTGDTVTFGTPGFAAYDASGYETVNTGYTVTVGELSDGKYTVTVSKS